ncbi:MAG: efflux transporter outer membrane subunit [Verrucomicrobiaceae bacterium]|nr:efflux transporter outer membrane subunit [Verrucomicrobiaceae bacterium]
MRLYTFLVASFVTFSLADTPPLPTAWKSKAPGNKVSAGLDDWWTVFNDPELNKLIAEAKASFPGMKAVIARVDQARAAVRMARSALLPNIMATGDLGRSRASDTVYDFSFGTLTNYGAAAQLSYEVDLWGRVRDQVNAAKADAESENANVYAVGLILSGEVARVYYAMRSIDEEKDVLDKTLKLRHEALKLATARVEAGATNELDRVRAEAELATTEAELAALAGPRAELENTLAVTLGKVASGYKVAPAKLPASLPPVPKLLPSELLQRRPDIVSATRRIDAARLRVGATETSYFPKVSLGAGYGTQTSHATKFLDGDSQIWNVGLRLSIPIFVGGQRKAAVDAARAVLAEATGLFEEKLLIAFKEVESLMSRLEAQQKQAESQTRLQTAADAAAKLARQRYTEGVATYLEVIEAERTSLSARRSLVQLRGQRLLTTVQLIQALGGGWNQSPTPKP